MSARICFGMGLAAALAFHPATGSRAAEPVKKAKVEFRLGQLEPGEGLTEMTSDGQKIYVAKKASLTNADVESARAVEATDPEGRETFAVEVRMTKEGGAKLAELTEKNRMKLLAIFVDDKLITAPVIREKIGSRAWITGKYTKKDAEALAARVNGKE
jgi:preprotein translocase subunit SecD